VGLDGILNSSLQARSLPSDRLFEVVPDGPLRLTPFVLYLMTAKIITDFIGRMKNHSLSNETPLNLSIVATG
jgi:hypothetical protein